MEQVTKTIIEEQPRSDAILNRTRGTLLFERPRWALTVWQQARGLMFRKPGPKDCIIFLFLPSRPVSFHMFFVFEPIDIIALDGTGKVIALRENFRPWTMWRPGLDASAVVELPAGTIAKSGTAVGDVIELPKTTGKTFAAQ
jgi:uncharacterized membrane protein (UPF0127 family)